MSRLQALSTLEVRNPAFILYLILLLTMTSYSKYSSGQFESAMPPPSFLFSPTLFAEVGEEFK